jgi:hypothetical protein
MKKCIAIIVTLCLVLQCAVQLGIMGLYRVNKSYIAKNLCVNRDKPKIGCNGKCYLKKQLKKASRQQEKENKGSQEEVATATVFVLPARWQPTQAYFNDVLMHTSHYTAPKGVSFSADIFHPPQVST